jgi:hypothetical protein
VCGSLSVPFWPLNRCPLQHTRLRTVLLQLWHLNMNAVGASIRYDVSKGPRYAAGGFLQRVQLLFARHSAS